MRRSASAFTLLEILISVVVLVVGVLCVMTLLPAVARTGAEVERGQEISRRVPNIVATLQESARNAQVVRLPGGQRAAFMVLPHPAALDPPAADLTSIDVFTSRACLLLPRRSDKVFMYPRSGGPEDIRRQNGAGRVANATGAGPITEDDARDVETYTLQDSPRKATIGFALRIQRAHIRGVPADGLYSVTIMFFLEPPDGPKRLLETFTTEVAAGPWTPRGDVDTALLFPDSRGGR